MFKHIKFLFFVLTFFASCDFNADELEYMDLEGAYKGKGYLTIFVNDPAGINIGETHYNYGDTVVQKSASDDAIIVEVKLDTNYKMSVHTFIPSMYINGKNISIDNLQLLDVPFVFKGNRVCSWGYRDIPTESTVLPIETTYVEVVTSEFSYKKDEGPYVKTTAKGELMALVGNFTTSMELILYEAPGLAPDGCAIALEYDGIMF